MQHNQSLLNKVLDTWNSASLQGKTFLFYLTSAFVIIVVWGLLVDKALTHNQSEALESQLSNSARELQALITGEQLTTIKAAPTFPVHYHLGNPQSAAQTEHWPTDCGITHSKQPTAQSLTLRCSSQRVLHVMSTDIQGNAGRQELVLWSVTPQASLFSYLTFRDVVIGLALLVALAYFAARKTTRSYTRPLNSLTQVAQHFREGDYEYESKTTCMQEIDQVLQEFRNLGKTLLDRDQYFRIAAFRDQLTGLDNRNFLNLNLNQHIRQANEPLMILTWSLDNLDDVYDVLGQDMIEKVLVQTGRKARRLCPSHLSLARLEGNLFCLVAPMKDLCGRPEQLPQRLFTGQVKLGTYSIDMRCHAGLATFPEDGQDADSLIRRADVARQLARRTGQRLVRFTSSMEKRSRERLARAVELKQAINQGEFELYLQPKLNIRSGQISQAECLMRWIHPEKGIISPASFIELAEQTGLIKDISRWVMTEGYRLCEILSEYNLGVSLNVSAIDLADHDLLNQAIELHHAHPDLTRLITLEVTESSTMHDPEQARDLLNRFSALGFKISVDDFGSGYSSLSYLKRFPVSELKIDRSLVQGADMDTDAAIIIQSTIEMGHTMGLVVTVEGVETTGELELVQELGADYIQGFILSEPLSLNEFRERFFLSVQDQVTQPV